MPLTPEEQKRARKKALQLLEHMDRTEKGLSDRLCQAGFSSEAAADAMEYVKGYGYIDDLRYARNYLLTRFDAKSRKQLFQELYQKGISKETAAAAWEEVCQVSQRDEREILRDLILKKWGADQELDEKSYRRLLGAVMRKGFGWEDISAVLEELRIACRPSWKDGE